MMMTMIIMMTLIMIMTMIMLMTMSTSTGEGGDQKYDGGGAKSGSW